MKKNLVSEYRNLIYFTEVGLSMVSPILLCIGIGWLLKRYFDTPPAVMVVLILLGLASGVHSAVRILRRMMRNCTEKNSEELEERNDIK